MNVDRASLRGQLRCVYKVRASVVLVLWEKNVSTE